MALTDNLKRQHKELLQVATDLAAILQVDKLAKDSTTARTLLSTLAGRLSVHLQMEDKSLYPHLLSQNNEQIVSLTTKYINEMGGIKKSFDTFSKRWPNSVRIQENPEEFIQETRGIIDILLNRMSKEDRELYPMVDHLL